MSKKKIVLTIILISIIIIIIFGLLGITLYNNLTNYSNVLKLNWNIEFPRNSIKEIYSANSDTSFNGDGIRYHIFSYKNEDEINELFNWSSEEKETIFYSSYSESINNLLDKINVSKENYPNYSNCMYWYNKQNDNSEIIIILNSNENILYVVESFL